MKRLLIFLLIGIMCAGCSLDSVGGSNKENKEIKKEDAPAVSEQIAQEPPANDIKIIDHPIKWSDRRETLIKEYAKMHYDKDMVSIDPQVVVVHWTATDNIESVFNYFHSETMPDDGGGTLNVASHFLVDRDGTIYRLTPETALNRHAIGYNWCAIGIENVGGENGKENLTEEQLKANIALIKYLKGKYKTIRYVWGHHQQDVAKESGLFIEKVPDYYAGKIDPGKKFMDSLRKGLSDTGLVFYE